MSDPRLDPTELQGRIATLEDGRRVRLIEPSTRSVRHRGATSHGRLQVESVWRVEDLRSGTLFVVRDTEVRQALDRSRPPAAGLEALLGADPTARLEVGRPPDRRWTRRDWAVVEVWLVDCGRPLGARLDWRLNGEDRTPLHFPHPAIASEHLSRWEATDTMPACPPAPGLTATLRSGRRVRLVARRMRRVSGRTVAHWQVAPLPGEDFATGQRPFEVRESEIRERVEAVRPAAHQMKSGRMRPGVRS